jgi:1,4-dihydroxy-2-naphthoyl-CoA synthase
MDSDGLRLFPFGGALVARQDKVLTITLNAPETLDAFTGTMRTSMSRIWDDVNDDPDVHVVVLTGAVRAFFGRRERYRHAEEDRRSRRVGCRDARSNIQGKGRRQQ